MRRVLAILLAFAAALTLAPSAGAQADESGLGIRGVDSTDADAVEVTFYYDGDRADVADLVLREDGRVQETSEPAPLEEQQAVGVVLVIDASGSMEVGALIEKVKAAAHEFVAGASPTDQIAVVSFNRNVTLEQGFTTDKEALDAAIEGITLDEDTSLYDAIVRAASLFEDSTLQPNVVVFSDGGDTTSEADQGQAAAAVKKIGGTVFAVGVENDDFDSLAEIASATGGSATTASNPEGVSELFAGVQTTLHRQYIVSYASTAESGPVPIELTVGAESADAEFVMGSSQAGAAALEPQVIEEPSGPAFLRGGTGLYVGLGLLALALIVVIFSVGSSFFGGSTALNTALQPYAEGYGEGDSFDPSDDGRGSHLAQTPLLQRAVAATGDFAERRGFLTWVEGLLERANLPLRPPEALFFYAVGVVLVALLLVVVATPLMALAGLLAVALIPPAILSFLANRRRKQFEALLPDTLQLLASTLRAGFSLMQGVEAVSTEVSEPMGRELRRVVTEARLGRPLEEALDGVSNRMESGDFAWAVMAISIQREVGGNLAELLVTVADTMTERERLRRDVNALTAEGKISAIVLAILPIGLGFFIMSINPEYMDPLFDTTVGKGLLAGSVLLALFGFWWMKKTIEIDI